MSFRAAFGSVALLLVCGLLAPAGASAQIYDELTQHRDFSSPEHFALEFRIGPYQPDMGRNNAFSTFFGSDHGPMFGLELEVVAYRLKDVLYVNGAGGIAKASYLGHTLDSTGLGTAEKTTFSLLPLDLLAVLRVDVLARKLSVPFILTGKIGYQWGHWAAQDGKAAEVSGWSVGMRWAAQLALDLDVFDQKAARRMDEEWGINHSFIFFELFGWKPSPRSLPIGGTAWTAGLGFAF